MSPLQISILLHYHCRTTDFRDGDFSAPAVRQSIDWMRDGSNLIQESNEDHCTRAYMLTERGQTYVEALKAVPLPVQVWQMPERGDD